jgi:hypothetical protein
MKIYLAIVMAVFALGTVGCGKNKAASKKCRTSKDCAACCTANGATGNASATVNGKYTCKCLGGD